MTEKLPTHNYKWMSEEELKEIDLLNYDLNGLEGMILISESITYKQTITFKDLSQTAQKIFQEVFPEKNKKLQKYRTLYKLFRKKTTLLKQKILSFIYKTEKKIWI